MHNEQIPDTRPGSFDEIVLPHLDAAHNLARWLMRGNDDADDVVQEACLRALRHFGTFRGGNARAWLLMIVRNTAFNWMDKTRTRHLATEFDENLHSEEYVLGDPEALLLERANTELLEQLMSHLPVRLREVLILRELEGLSYKEIAEIVGVPIGTVMSTLFRAREQFQRAVSDRARRHARPAWARTLDDDEQRARTRDAVPV